MFKEFEMYLADYEDSLRNAYLNASKARKDWANAYNNKNIDITTTSFYDRRKYSSICCAKVTRRAREDVLILNGSKYYVVVDYREIDDNLYAEIVNTIIKEEEKDGVIHYVYVCGRTAKMIEANYDGYHKFLLDRQVLEQDVNLTYGRDEKWIIERAHKDMLSHKKWIENKVEKMLGKVKKVKKVEGDGWYLHGSNGKLGHMWFVVAGGYNIQRFHWRCLLKEVNIK